MSAEIDDILQRKDSLKGKRLQWDNYYQELAEVLHPTRADFTTVWAAGQKRNLDIFDGSPMIARRGLATAIDALLKPKTSRWFNLRTDDEGINETEDAKIWFADTEDRMFAAIYAKSARFIPSTGIVDNDLVTFGTADLFIGLNRAGNGLIFRASHLRDVLIEENADGQVDTHFLTFRFNARQAIQKYGEANVGSKTREAAKGDTRQQQEMLEFLQLVLPREDRDTRRRDNRNLPIASLVIDVGSEHMVGESGFHEFPFATPRWETTVDEVYGRSPGMMALPDSKTLQSMGKTLLVAGQKATDPPMWALDDSVISAVQTFPGGMTVIDGEAARGLGGNPIGTLDIARNIPIGLEMQQDTRLQVEAAFFRNIFNLPIDRPQMTATEIIERKEEFVRALGPVFGQLEADYIGAIAERVFGLMQRAGAFRPPPDVLSDRNVRFELVSPIQRARKQIEAAAMTQSFEVLAPIVEAQPQILDNIDGDRMIRDIPDIYGIPHDWLRAPEEVAKIREAQAKAAQLQQVQQLAEVSAEVVNKVSAA